MLVLRSNLWGLVVVMATIVQSGEKKREKRQWCVHSLSFGLSSSDSKYWSDGLTQYFHMLWRSFSPLWELHVNRVFLFLGMRNCSHWLKFGTQHEGIEISNAVNMTRSRMFFPNSVRMIDFLINICLIQQIQGGLRYIARLGSF